MMKVMYPYITNIGYKYKRGLSGISKRYEVRCHNKLSIILGANLH